MKLSKPVKIAIISRIIVIIWAVLGFYILPLQAHDFVDGVETRNYVEQEATLVSPEKIFAKWDTNYYFNIIENGYGDNAENGFNPVWNFLPGYPITLFLLSFWGIIKSRAIITVLGVIFSNFIFVYAIHILTKIMKKVSLEQITVPAVALLSFYPGSIYYSFLYTESLFLLLFVGGYYFLLNKKYLHTSILFGLAMITRKIGIFLPIIFLVEVIRKWDIRSLVMVIWVNLKYFLVTLIPLALFVTYIHSISGDWLTIYKSQNAWSDLPPLPFVGIYDMVRDFRFTTISQIGAWSFFVVVLVAFRKKVKLSLVLYSVFCLIFITATGQVQGYIRYISVLFPLFILLANIKSISEKAYQFILYLFISGASVWTIMFVNEYSFVI